MKIEDIEKLESMTDYKRGRSKVEVGGRERKDEVKREFNEFLNDSVERGKNKGWW